MLQSFHKLLWIELLGGIGDLVIALPAIHAVARSHPQAHLTVLTFAPGAELLRFDPLIDQIVVAARGEARLSVDQLLATQQFDLIISDTTYDGIADAIHQYQTQQTPAPIVVTNLWRSPPDQERVAQRFLDILRSAGLIKAEWTEAAANSPLGKIHLTVAEKAAARQAIGPMYRPLIFLCPEAGMAIKRWPIDRFVQLGRILGRDGATLMIPAGADPGMADYMASQIDVELPDGTVKIWPLGQLRTLAAAMSFANLVIAGDTGLAHIAAALGVPTITLFGPSWSERYGQAAPQINLQGYPECSERIISNFTQQSCWYSGNCPFEWNTCLEAINLETVVVAAYQILHQSPPFMGDLGGHEQLSNSTKLLYTHSNLQKGSNELGDSAEVRSWRSVQNLLVMRLDNIGDVIMTSPVLQAIKEALPQAQVTLMASPAGSQVAPLLPWVDQVLTWRVLWQDLGQLAFDPEREWQLIQTLKRYHFDAAIILTSFSQSPHPAGFVCAMAGIPLRLGESKETDRHTLTHAVPPAPDDLHQVDRNLHLIESIGFPVRNRYLSLSLPDASPDLVRSPYLLLNPWTSCPSRNYPVERFAVVADRLNRVTGWPVVVTGMEKDRDRSQFLFRYLGDRAINLIGQTSLMELVRLVAQANLVLTNNTSVMHVADAIQTPLVVLFAGTEQESQWSPRHTQFRLLRRSTVCSPCYAFDCPYQLQCLDISPETVVAAALELLQPQGGEACA